MKKDCIKKMVVSAHTLFFYWFYQKLDIGNLRLQAKFSQLYTVFNQQPSFIELGNLTPVKYPQDYVPPLQLHAEVK
ncbi:hypothetical protein CUU66_20035 [Peribacillus deserti]|uniref:Uncharacterized protein n=1 Tax=Peribacillus deserti TaxID=673318 RepID=A0A2N5M1L0_9BACI|nr:hypothetical protein CUU66_20035 [Peribacillus deserti]